MTREDALELLQLSAGATRKQIQEQYTELFNDYQIRLEHAPTPALRKLYQRNLGELESAHRLLTADFSEAGVGDLPAAEPVYVDRSVPTPPPPTRRSAPLAHAREPAPRPTRETTEPATPLETTGRRRKWKFAAGTFAVLVVLILFPWGQLFNESTDTTGADRAAMDTGSFVAETASTPTPSTVARDKKETPEPPPKPRPVQEVAGTVTPVRDRDAGVTTRPSAATPRTLPIERSLVDARSDTATQPARQIETAPPAVASVSIVRPGPVVVGESRRLAAQLLDAGGTILTGRSVSWSSENPLVASVEATSGALTANAPGSVTITATAEGKVARMSLDVSPRPAPVVTQPPPPPPGARGAAEAQIRALIHGYVTLLETADVNRVAALFESPTSPERSLLNTIRAAESKLRVLEQKVEPPVLAGERAVVNFSLRLTWKTAFGASRTEWTPFRAEFENAGGTWRMIRSRIPAKR